MNARTTNQEPTACEAYVINDDGTKTAIPIGFADYVPNAGAGSAGANGGAGFASKATGVANRAATAAGGRRRGGVYGANANASGYAPQDPFTTVNPATGAPKRSLHIARRIAGLGIAAIGVPLLILPGPGLALIGLGLIMVIAP